MNVQSTPMMVHQISEIIPRIYLTSWKSANDLQTLLDNKVTHIVNLSGMKNRYCDHFSYLSIEVQDHEKANIKKHFSKINRFIHNNWLNGGVIVVHCMAGVSRSPTVIIAYLTRKHKMDLNRAIDLVKEKRNIIQPNSGFMDQLNSYVSDTTNDTIL
jgi:protein-tyrosine phosphatase